MLSVCLSVGLAVNGKSTQQGQFEPTAAEGNRFRRLRMANETVWFDLDFGQRTADIKYRPTA